MTREETQDVLAVIDAAYPNFNPKDLTVTVNLWHSMLYDYPADRVLLAVKKYIATDRSGFAPSIGQVIDAMSETEEMNGMQAWSLVAKAIRNSYYGAEDEFAKLPEVVQKAVGTPGQLREWGQMKTNEVQTVVMSNFMRSYDVESERERVCKRMPTNIRPLIQNATERMIEGV